MQTKLWMYHEMKKKKVGNKVAQINTALLFYPEKDVIMLLWIK